MKTLEEMRASDSVLFECVSGSQAYGLATPQSDLDLKGVFIMPQDLLYSLDTVEQLSDATNDTVFYELGRFLELLQKANPNLLEMLYTPEDCVRVRHPLMDRIPREMFLSQQCRASFAGYAETQIRKARGLNKKIVNPMPKERRTVLDFCYVTQGQGSIPAAEWLAVRGLDQNQIGLVNVPHMPRVYAMFADRNGEFGYAGICRGEESNDVRLSSIPKEEEAIGHLCFNHDGYKKFCRQHGEYWAWVANRNETRYQQTVQHGGEYDAKNMMHTFRLLDLAADIARDGTLHVRTEKREALLAIRNGERSFEALVAEAEERLLEIDELYAASDLSESCTHETVNQLLIELRAEWYSN